MMKGWSRLAAVGVAVLGPGCGLLDELNPPDVDTSGFFDSLGVPVGAGLGEDCERDEDCISGRICDEEERVCAATGDAGEGDDCWVTLDCGDGLYCNAEDNTCAPAGDAGVGDECEGTADCERGLLCALDGVTRRCAESTGTTDVGRPCEQSSECLAGLICADNPALDLTEEDLESIPDSVEFDMESPMLCIPGELSLVSTVRVECAEVDEDADKQAYFVMPSDDDSGEFYRLPFPNDVRRRGGGIDLSGHFTPGDTLGFDFPKMYFDEVEREDGFSTNPTVYFRFSHEYEGSTVNADSVQLFLLDEDSSTYGQSVAREWKVSSGKITNYICHNWLSVRSPHGVPLKGGATYAAVLTKDITPESGGSFAVPETLDALLSDSSPGGDLSRAHQAYAPLRALIAGGHLSRGDILNATVFTTKDPQATMPKLREAVRDRRRPAVSSLANCSEGDSSPCGGDAPRACQNESGMIELHGRIELPIFQHGDAPYMTPADGGDLVMDGDLPSVARTEDVCFALTLPESNAPEAGYPLVIYAHGTGGHYTSGIGNGVARAAAQAGGALLGIDMPQHGTRRGGSDRDPAELFFNFLNPKAARGNVAQGAADLMSLVYWAEGYDDEMAGQAVRFDASRIMLFGHSQGATHGSLIVPHEHTLVGAVLSGLGGDLGLALTHKQAPVDSASLVPQVLFDPEAAAPELCEEDFNCVGANHPVLSILQGFFDPVDAVNYAAGLADPPVGGTLKHVLQPIGEGDTYSPDLTMAAFARASDMPLVGPEVFAMTGVERASGAVSGNVSMFSDDEAEVSVTQAIVQFAPASGEDGHFVSFDVGKSEVDAFMQAVLRGETPTVDP